MPKNNSTRKEMLAVEIVIGKIMRIGVLFSATVMILGFAMFLITGHSGYPNTSFPTTLPAIWQGLISFKPYPYLLGVSLYDGWDLSFDLDPCLTRCDLDLCLLPRKGYALRQNNQFGLIDLDH